MIVQKFNEKHGCKGNRCRKDRQDKSGMKDWKVKKIRYLKREIHERLLLEIMKESILDERQREQDLKER